jgi:Xaa-Pro dipeptidase
VLRRAVENIDNRCSTAPPPWSTALITHQRRLKPGVRENDIVARSANSLYRHGSDDVEAINAISGRRATPARTISPTACCARATRRSSTFAVVHGLSHVLLPHLQCRTGDAGADAYKKAREWLDRRSRSLKEPGVAAVRRLQARAARAQSSAQAQFIERTRQLDLGMGLASRCTSGRPSLAWISLDHPTGNQREWCSRSRPYCPRMDG